jgi:hypothetical protein
MGPIALFTGPAYGRLATAKLTKRHGRVRGTARCKWLIQVGCTSGTLVPYDIIYDLTLSFTVYDIICDII